MDIHKPKPWHGLREFLKEYGIIVLGVLTALALEQGVDWAHTHREVAESRAALQGEIAQNAARGVLGVAQGKCLLAWTDRVITWAKGGERPPAAVLSGTSLSSTDWEASRAGPVLKMPTEERLKFAHYYDTVENEKLIYQQFRAPMMQVDRYLPLSRLTTEQSSRLIEEVNVLKPTVAAHVVQEGSVVRAAKLFDVQGKPPSEDAKDLVVRLCRAAGSPAPDFRVDTSIHQDFEWYAGVVSGTIP